MPDDNGVKLETWIKRKAEEVGFALCGIARADVTDYGEHVKGWLAGGKHGEMGYLANNLEMRLDVRALLPGAKSVICVGDRLPVGDGEESGGDAEVWGKLARYVHVSDYHKVMKRKLFALCDALREQCGEGEFKVCVDTAPVLEREHAQRAGLGWVGKHTLLIHREVGSHLMLGEIVTTLELEEDERETDHCGTCTRCIEACPTDCITPYSVDASRCLSYLTIEYRGMIEVEDHAAVGDWLFGCDICQDVCPHNNRVPDYGVGEGYEGKVHGFDVVEVLDWGEAERRAAFLKSALKRAKLDMFKRNALIVLGNAMVKRIEGAGGERDEWVLEMVDKIRNIVGDVGEGELVQMTGKQVLKRVEGV